jgi:hypothetical protein
MNDVESPRVRWQNDRGNGDGAGAWRGDDKQAPATQPATTTIVRGGDDPVTDDM